MILFKEDWLKYNSAIIDYRTSNKSALEMAAKLRIMGVENNAFFLALHNPDLQGVDPFSKNLSIDQMAAIGIEIKNNPWYFFREIAKAPAKAGLIPSPIEFNRANIALWWCFFNHITFILIQPRQTGKSFSTDLMMTYLYNFRCNNTQINLLTKDDKLRVENVKRLKDVYEELPAYLKFKTRDDTNNTEEISIKKFGNTYVTHVPNASEKRATNIGRGMTTPIFHIDEPPFQPNIHIAYPAAMGAMGAAIEAAKANEEPYGIILTTTAGKKDSKEGAYVFAMCEDSATMTERFYGATNTKELEQMVRRNSRKGLYQIYAVYSHTQLGKDDDWLRSQLERLNSTPEEANMDFFCRWSSGSQSSPLPQYILEKLKKSVVQPTHTSISKIGGYVLRWYIPEDQVTHFMSTRKTIIGIDSSDASGGDDISLVMVDVESGRTIAVGNFNETNLITFSQWLVYLLVTYENSTMIIERKSSGVTILDYLLLFLPEKEIDPFKRLFNWVVNDPYEYPERYSEATTFMPRRPQDTYVRAKKYFGFATSGSGQTARSELYSTTLQNAAKRVTEGVLDASLTNQITGLITKNGRVDHAPGEHDDLVIGFLLCHWFLTMAKNLQHYGIDPKSILSLAVQKKEMTEDEYYEETIQHGIRSRIEELFLIMSNESDPYVTERYERELRRLDSKLILKNGESFSIDSFLNTVKEKRGQSRQNTQYANRSDYRERMGYAVDIDRSRLPSNTYVL